MNGAPFGIRNRGGGAVNSQCQDYVEQMVEQDHNHKCKRLPYPVKYKAMAYPDPKPLPGFVTLFAYGVGLFLIGALGYLIWSAISAAISAISAALN